MVGTLDRLAVEEKLLSHKNITGVGYGAAVFTVTGPDEDCRFLVLFRCYSMMSEVKIAPSQTLPTISL